MPTRSPIIVPQHPFVKAVATALRKRCGLSCRTATGYRVLVATSGGADSVALLRAMAALARRRTWQLELAVGHVQHHLRHDSEDDARFVADLACGLELPFYRADLDLTRFRGNLEAHARQQRYKALEALAVDFNARHIVAAHHGDDQLETLLMRILRGSSVRGLGCMAWRRPLHRDGNIVLLRPMLGVDRRQIDEFLDVLNQPWCQDHTNTDLSRLRARLRHEVVPVLRDVCRDAAAKSVAIADHMRQIHQLIDSEAAEHQKATDHGNDTTSLARRDAKQMPQVVLTALLRRLLVEAGGRADRMGQRTMGPIIRAVRDPKGGRRVFVLTGGLQVVLTRDAITVLNTRRLGS